MRIFAFVWTMCGAPNGTELSRCAASEAVGWSEMLGGAVAY